MNRRDLHNSISPVTAMLAASLAAPGTTAGILIDRTGYDTAEFLIPVVFTQAGQEVVVTVKEGALADGSDQAAVIDAGDLLTNFRDSLTNVDSGLSVGAGNTVLKIGYLGTKQYISISAVTSGTADAGHHVAVSGTCLLADAHLEGNINDNREIVGA